MYFIASLLGRMMTVPQRRTAARGEDTSGFEGIHRIAAVAHDEELAGRIRELIGDEPGLKEQKMFGGLAFLIGGNMAVAASGQGGLLVRVDPTASDGLVAETNARPMEMRGRELRGWLRVDADDVSTDTELQRWVGLGTDFARSLPPKR
jgi:TfoX N-terminal domain